VIAIGFFGNLLVVTASIQQKALRTPRNAFIINLAVSDILLCLVTMPLSGRNCKRSLATGGFGGELQSGGRISGRFRFRIHHNYHGNSTGSLSAHRLPSQRPFEERRRDCSALFHLVPWISPSMAHLRGSGD